jgi:hypothetical protein
MADGEAVLPRFGLYYPYVNFRDERWVKLAALYWPKLPGSCRRTTGPGTPTSPAR